MDAEQTRLYRREWKRNKPYLPKSTSLPLLRLIPENKAVFVCKQCGFSNFLVPMCLWCCWSSTEARREFEETARKNLRRAARSAPRLFGKPALATNPRKNMSVGDGKQTTPLDRCCQTPTSKSPYATRPSAVTTNSARVHPFSYRATHSSYPRCRSAARGNREKGETVVKEPITTSSEPDTQCGIDGGRGTGSGENNSGPPTVQHPRLTADVLPNGHAITRHKGKAKDATGSLTSPPSVPTTPRTPPRSSLPEPCPCQLVLEPAAITAHSPTRIASTLTTSPREPLIYARSSRNVVHRNEDTPRSSSKTPNPIRTMQLDSLTTDTRRDTINASYVEPSLSTTAARVTIETRHGKTDHRIRNFQEIPSMDTDVATVTQFHRVPNSPMSQSEALDASEQTLDSDMNAMTNTTLTKTGRKRAPIPSMLLHQDSSHTDTPITVDTPESHIPTTEMTIDTNTKDTSIHAVSPPRTLRRQKKRLSLSGLTAAVAANSNANSLAPPDLPVPFSPPPVRRSSSQSTPTLPVAVTPPDSPNQNSSPHMNRSPAIVISAPAPADPPRPNASPTPQPPPTLPRIGTPKRPYYTTVRANMNGRPASGTSQLSTPPASPSSPTYSSISAGRSPSRASGGAPGSPDSSGYPYLTANTAQRPSSMLVDGATTTGDATIIGANRPASTSAVVTVPPLPPVVNAPVPIPIPVQMQMRPSSPVRSILSVLDPTNGDDEDEDMEYNQFGMGPGRFGKVLREKRSGKLKNKGKSKGETGGSNDFHFPLSLSLSLGRKRGRGLTALGLGSEKEKDLPPLPVLSTSRSYAAIGGGGFGPGRGCSMSGEMEMRMALAERNLNANGDNGNGLQPAFRFQRPSCDVPGEGRMSRDKGSGGRKLIKMRSTIGFTSSSSMGSPTSSPSKPRIGSRLKEMSVNFLGRFHGGDTNHP